MPWANRKHAATELSVPREARSAQQIELEPAVPRLHKWSPEVFNHIEWRRFEAVCEALYSQAGVRTNSQSHGPDGGVDIWLHLQNATKPMIVQCKHWTRKVKVDDVRAFYGVLKSHDLDRGIFATSSTFTADAMEFARAHGISAQDRNGLLNLIASRAENQRVSLLDTAYDGEYWRPTCASCGIKMKAREPKGGGPVFWGCANFGKTRCGAKIQLRASDR